MSTVNRNSGQQIDEYRDLSSRNFYFGFFDNWKEFFEQNSVLREQLASQNDYFRANFYRNYEVDSIRAAEKEVRFKLGTDETQNIDELNSGFFGTYQQQELLDNVVQAFTDILADIDMGGSFKKSKLIITDRPQGIFDFGLASLGLFAEQEFFSEKLAIESPLEFPNELSGIVPNIFVTKNQLGDFWYVSNETGKKYKMTQQDKGTRKGVLDGYPEDEIPSKYKTYRTRQKKSYLLFKKEGGKAKKVDLYIPMGGSGSLQESGMLARSLPVIMAARFFESVGIRTRVNATRIYEATSYDIVKKKRIPSEGDYLCIPITIKDFGEDIDFTRMAISVADNRTFRWGLWKYLPAYLAKTYNVTNVGYGNPVYGGSGLLETTRRFKNWYANEIEKGVPLVKMEKPLQIFGGLPLPPTSYTYTGKQDSTYNAIIKEFYRILDTVDMYYNKPKDAYNRIYKRWVETKDMTVSQFKVYIQDVLARSYSVAVDGDYADKEDEAEKLEDEFDAKIDILNEFLLNLE